MMYAIWRGIAGRSAKGNLATASLPAIRPQGGERADQVADRERADAGPQRERVGSRVDHVEPLEPEILERAVHRARQRRGRRPLELETEAPVAVGDQQIELRAGVRGPEPALVGTRPQARDGLAERPA